MLELVSSNVMIYPWALGRANCCHSLSIPSDDFEGSTFDVRTFNNHTIWEASRNFVKWGLRIDFSNTIHTLFYLRMTNHVRTTEFRNRRQISFLPQPLGRVQTP